jgi:hypothetical protein
MRGARRNFHPLARQSQFLGRPLQSVPTMKSREGTTKRLDDELAEIGRRAHHHCAAQVGKLCAQLGIGENRVDLLVEHDSAGVFSGVAMPFQCGSSAALTEYLAADIELARIADYDLDAFLRKT